MARKTRIELFMMLDRVNKNLNTKLNLNNASCYGGWQLTNFEGNHIIKSAEEQVITKRLTDTIFW